MSNKSGVSQQIISLPKGGGAIRGIGETFKPNLFTGTANFSVPITTSPGRDGFGPELSLQYSSGNGNGPFGLGWALSIPQVSRKTEKGLPKYTDEDIFLLSGTEDLVERADRPPRDEGDYEVTTYRPRIEGLFARIEKWEHKRRGSNPQLSDVFWKVTTKEGVTSIYGRTPQAILAHLNSLSKIYQWLLELTYDTKGNYIHYEYKKEDGVGIPGEIFEQNREHHQIYIKRIQYGNLIPFDPFALNSVETLLSAPLKNADHFFKVLFDYGEHGSTANGHELITSKIYKEEKPWACRSDPFSSFRAGFEVRTHRRCKRVLMFHNKIPNETEPVLVKSTDFYYEQNKDTLVSMLIGVTQRGYKKTSAPGDFKSEEITYNLGVPGVRSTIYEIRSIPRLDFRYTVFRPKKQRYQPFQARGGDMPSNGLNDPNTTLVDLFGTGVPDVLQTTATGYYFWRNLGGGLFNRRQILKNMPAGITLDQNGVDFGDMNGNGHADLLVHRGQLWGFYEATNDGGWKIFHPYQSFPSFSLADPNVRLVDLTGDGRSDVLRSDQHHLTLFPCLAEKGFGSPQIIERRHDLDLFPDIYFDDPAHRVHLADMTGDGLKDIVLVHSGRIDYWPNLGYGDYGKRITMKNAPQFGYNFDPNHLFFIDIDASGPADLIYVESGNVRFWFNQSGNGWSAENVINGTPTVTDLDSIQMADMFGNGSTGILWSMDYCGPQQSNYLFLDLTGGVKPYILTEMNNNMGATTKAKYRSSTQFYLEDLKKREHWITTIPFPVQVLEKVEIIDHIAKSKLVTKYTYHHGFYDGREREFRGFGRVEQTDTEITHESDLHGKNDFLRDLDYNVFPVLTKSWLYTGVSAVPEEYFEKIKAEFYKGDIHSFDTQSIIEADMDPLDIIEAYRALKGATMRTEVYSIDDTSKTEHPYTVTENSYRVKCLQPKGKNKSGIFHVISNETFNYHYERNPDDPRINHKLTYEVDEFGNVKKSIEIFYQRRNFEFIEQKKVYLLYDEKQYINQDTLDKPYFVGLPYEIKKFELRNINSGIEFPIQVANVEVLNLEGGEHNIFSHIRHYYEGTPYKGLSLGQVGSRGLLTRTEKLAFNDDKVSEIYNNRVIPDDLIKAKYERSVNSNGWWVQSTRIKYGSKEDFFLPRYKKDPMGNRSEFIYDRMKILLEKTIGPLKTITESLNDYIVLKPREIIDQNLNHTEVIYDPLGRIVAKALKGKIDQYGKVEGDPIEHPTTEIRYDFLNFWKTSLSDLNELKPNYVVSFQREEHSAINPDSAIITSITYNDGFGREIQTKIEAEPEPNDHTQRWIGSGWKIYNNKGWIVAHFEPFYSKTNEFENDRIFGVSTIKRYDPLGRVIQTNNPDGTCERVDFSPWHKISWDSNDTITDSKYLDGTFVNKWYGEKSNGSQQEKDAATKALTHRNTPNRNYFDSFGRVFQNDEDNGINGKYTTKNIFDIQGNIVKVIDPCGKIVFEHKYDFLKKPLYRLQMDSGEITILYNAVGNAIKKWDFEEKSPPAILETTSYLIDTEYDELNRPTELWVSDLTTNPVNRRLAETTIYGDSENILNPEDKNLKGQIHIKRDEAGLLTYNHYDFKGNSKSSHRKILEDYKTPVDWRMNPNFINNNSPFQYEAQFDALNRIKESTAPDGSRFVPSYNKGNLIDKIDIYIRGSRDPTHIVLNVTYNAKGQREKIVYHNGVTRDYGYDPNTYRLASLHTYKDNKDFQWFNYTYDPIGNITSIQDLSAQSIFFQNTRVDSNRDYEYDPLYRLIKAEGREHSGQFPEFDYDEIQHITNIPHTNDSKAMRRYREGFQYDESGNIIEVKHRILKNGIWTEGWTRGYKYRTNNNQLEKTTKGRNLQPDFTYNHKHGNHVNFSHIRSIDWDHNNRMTCIDKGSGGGKIYYLYDSNGQRVRKIIENRYGIVQRERLYLGGYEIYKEYSNNNIKLKRETIHVMDDKERVALVETLVKENFIEQLPLIHRIRFQIMDHLSSLSLELDEMANVISFEEYYPYGGTSYHSARGTSQISLKRFRYSNKEKDEESGFYYYGVRYYIPWLGRWTVPDPLGEEADINLYRFNLNNPIRFIDPGGTQPTEYNQSHPDLDTTGMYIEEPYAPGAGLLSPSPLCHPEDALIKTSQLPAEAIDLQQSRTFPVTDLQRHPRARTFEYGYTVVEPDFQQPLSAIVNDNDQIWYQLVAPNYTPLNQGRDPSNYYAPFRGDCAAACYEMSRNMGLNPPGPAGERFSVVRPGEINRTGRGEAQMSTELNTRILDTIEESLYNGNPVMVGVDYTEDQDSSNLDNVTDHWLVIFRRGYTPDGKLYFEGYDNAVGALSNDPVTRFYVDPNLNIYKAPEPLLNSVKEYSHQVTNARIIRNTP